MSNDNIGNISRRVWQFIYLLFAPERLNYLDPPANRSRFNLLKFLFSSEKLGTMPAIELSKKPIARSSLLRLIFSIDKLDFLPSTKPPRKSLVKWLLKSEKLE